MTNDIQRIDEANLISDENLARLTKISSKINKGFDHRIIFRPEYLMRVSVLNDMKHPTPDAKYWQANLERDVHFHELVYLSFDYREKQADIEIKHEKLVDLTSTAMQKKARIQIERMETDLVFMKKTANDRVREVTTWTKIMDELEPYLEFGKDDPTAYMAKSFPISFTQQKQLM